MSKAGPKTAIIAGQGALPALLVAALQAAGTPFLLAELDGFPVAVPGLDPVRFRVERLVPFFDYLADAGVTRVCLAGAVRRPRLEPEFFDPRTATLVPRLLAALQTGDDGALRLVIALFEEFGFEVVGADALAPDLLPGPGILAGQVTEADQKDAARAAAIVAGLGALDLGQGAVVAQGLCLAVESLPGTDAMLDFVGLHALRLRPDPAGAKGMLYKAPKPGQDRRIDLPTLGPDTVRAVQAAGIGGIAWAAGAVLLLDRAEMIKLAGDFGLFLWSRQP